MSKGACELSISADTPRGTDWEKANRNERESLETGMPDMMCLALSSNKQPGCLLYPMYSTDT